MRMRLGQSIRRGAVAAIVLASTGSLFAQYPSQQNGHALDANFGVGQFGINDQRGVPQPIVNSGNLIVSGNVTRGFGFRGVSPIRDYSYLSFNVPSATLNPFLSDSTSINQIVSQGQYGVTRPQAFFAPNESVVTGAAISSGIVSPSTAYVRSSVIDLDPSYGNLGQTPYTTNIQSIYDTRNLPQSNALRPDIIGSASVRQSGGLVNPALLDSPLLATNPSLRARYASQQANLLDTGAAQQLAGYNALQQPMDPSSLTEAQRNEIAGTGNRKIPQLFSHPNADTPPPTATADRADAQPLDHSVKMELDENGVYQVQRPQNGPGAAGPASSNIMRQPPEPVRTGPKVGQPGAAGAQRSGALQPGFIQPGAASMSDSAQTQRPTGETGGLTQPSSLVTPVNTQGTGVGAQGGTSGALGSTPRPVSGEPISPQDMAAPNKIAPSQRDLVHTGGPDPMILVEGPVTTLAGGANTRVNKYLNKAEALLKAGDYFRACSQYDLALLVDRNNPVIWLGHGNASAAAGDYASAVRSLLTAINGYDGVAKMQLDLNTFIPDGKLLESRRADLESRLAEREHTELRFLLGYLEYFSGLQRYGMDNLKRAASMAKPGTTIARFPSMIEQARGSQE